MMYGIGGGDGWFDLIETGCSLVQHHVNSAREQRARAIQYNRVLNRALIGDKAGLIWYHSYKGKISDWTLQQVERDIEESVFRIIPDRCTQVVAAQVKEKFGTLRFYFDGGDGYCRGVISMMEVMSGKTCMYCGNPGKVRTGGWLQALCDSCNTEKQKADKHKVK
jgi:hypothetical protein